MTTESTLIEIKRVLCHSKDARTSTIRCTRDTYDAACSRDWVQLDRVNTVINVACSGYGPYSPYVRTPCVRACTSILQTTAERHRVRTNCTRVTRYNCRGTDLDCRARAADPEIIATACAYSKYSSYT